MIDILTGTAFDAPKRFNHREDEVALEFPSSVSQRARGLNALKAQNWKAAKKSAPTARDYVQAGLIHMWDGIENAGWGVHDGTAQTWTDLVGSNHITAPTTLAWGEEHLQARAMHTNAISLSFVFYEIVVRRIANGYFLTNGNNNVLVGYYATNKFIVTNGAQGTSWPQLHPDAVPLNAIRTISHSPKDSSYHARVNGSVGQAGATEWFSNYRSDFQIAARTANSNCANTDFFCIRLYSRVLTDAEISANYAVDAARFNPT